VLVLVCLTVGTLYLHLTIQCWSTILGLRTLSIREEYDVLFMKYSGSV
jgi:hypothetical protein